MTKNAAAVAKGGKMKRAAWNYARAQMLQIYCNGSACRSVRTKDSCGTSLISESDIREDNELPVGISVLLLR